MPDPSLNQPFPELIFFPFLIAYQLRATFIWNKNKENVIFIEYHIQVGI